jgi:hypothetical protein
MAWVFAFATSAFLSRSSCHTGGSILANIMNATQVNLESPACQELPELHLWSEVLLLAIYDSRCQASAGKPHDKRRVQRSARAWIRSKSEHPGSFKWCCEMLGLDPQAVQVLLQYPDSPASIKQGYQLCRSKLPNH